MNTLHSLFAEALGYDFSIDGISAHMDWEESQVLNYTPWSAYPYQPLVKFAIAHCGDCIFLKYFVEEKYIRSVNNEINSAVYEDSCVEFFISFNNGKEYYNIEFNCIGTGRIGFGKSKEARLLLPVEIINKIKYKAVLHNDHAGNTMQWQLTLAIPCATFIYDQIESIRERECLANFYKCGDQLPEPHFVTWNNIEYPEPNFHLPAFFGKLVFK